MSIQLIFIRHGAAEDGAQSRDDFARRLTTKGEQALRETLPAMLPLIDAARELQIWSSPLIRAKQTAEIAAEIAGKKQLKYFDFIGEGQFAPFREALQNLDKTADHTIIIVGHEPHLGEWAAALSGNYLPFKKGAAAGFMMNAEDQGTAELQWFMQPQSMGKLRKKSKTDNVFADIQDVLEKQAQKVLRMEADFLADPQDIEKVHQLRVNVRVLRSIITFAGPFQKARQNANIQNRLKKFVREFSYLRELDVLREECEKFSVQKQEIMPRDSVVFDVLSKERETELRRIIMRINEADCVRTIHDIGKDLRKTAWRNNFAEENSIKDIVQERFSDLYEVFGQDMDALDYGDQAAAHALRKKAKMLRYILSSMESLMQRRFDIAAADLIRIQDTLGELCDARRNKDILRTFDQRELPASAHKELAALIEYLDHLIREKIAQAG